MLSDTTNYTISFQAMGSHIQAWLSTPNEADAQILAQVPDWFELWEAEFSRFRQDSALNRLNLRAGHWTAVSKVMFDVIAQAVDGAGSTRGLFNPLILPALTHEGYGHSFDPETFVPDDAPLGQEAAWVADFNQIDLDPKRRYVRLPRGAQIDLGGIVKGWAAQQTANRLAEVGPCLVDAGGDMAAFGSPDDSDGWLVVVGDPNVTHDQPDAPYMILLRDAAVATSGTDYRRWTRNGQLLHHLIDPRTGHSATSDVLSATVIAPDAVTAEIWAKASLIGGDLPSAPALPTYFIRHDGSIAYNQEFMSLCNTSTSLC